MVQLLNVANLKKYARLMFRLFCCCSVCVNGMCVCLNVVKMHGLLICRNSWYNGLMFCLFTLTKSRQCAADAFFPLDDTSAVIIPYWWFIAMATHEHDVSRLKTGIIHSLNCSRTKTVLCRMCLDLFSQYHVERPVVSSCLHLRFASRWTVLRFPSGTYHIL